ncbi:hypothetical protein G9A89_007826 [Geosiphon pyriformis]|nr:hypothetical protein G9A89_007826 [Geosiphon pyriformis]
MSTLRDKNNELCLTCGEQLLDKGMWNDIPSQERTCNTLCQYTILISNWVSHETPITAAWHRAISYLEGYPHDKDEIWQITNAKVEGASPSKILEIKNNSPEPTDKKIEPISSCALESESLFNPDSISDNDDNKNTSSVQNGNKKNSNLDSDSNPKIYITLSNLTKEQTLKWFSNNKEKIMPKCAHNTDTRGGIIDARYVGNIVAMLQNNSEKAYIIEPNEKIAQAIFLFLVKIAQLVSVGNREELGITAKGIQEFGSTGRIDIPVNMAEKEIVGQGEIISTGQAISILPYDQYILCGYVDITSQTIYGQNKCYLLQPEQLEQMNIENLDPLQCIQLKMLLNNFNDIFISKNKFGRTDIIQHQIKTKDTMSIKQQAYRIPLTSHEIIH